MPRYARTELGDISFDGTDVTTTSPLPGWLYHPTAGALTTTSENSDQSLDVHVSNTSVVQAVGATSPANVVPMGVDDGSNVRAMKGTTAGEPEVSVVKVGGGTTLGYGKKDLTNVAQLIMSSDATRRGFVIQNNSITTAIDMYVGGDASITSANTIKIVVGGVLEMSSIGTYTGDIYAIGSAASSETGNLRYWEILA